MKNGTTLASSIWIALMLTAAAHSEPTGYTFSTTGIISLDPLLTGLTSVSGSLIYENDAPPIYLDEFTPYSALSSLSGSVDGNSFSAPYGGARVYNDNFQGQLLDFFPSV